MDTHVSEFPEVLKSHCGFNCLTDICHYSFEEFRQQVSEHLSWSEARHLYHSAQQEQKNNRLYEARILTRANPQLQNAVHLAITTPDAELRGYNDEFGNRASQYVAPGAVSSMFSPAAYLTELYREARQLHAESSVYHLDKRRPDLKSLALSQHNMDSEVSTLSLSNELLMEGIQTKSGLDSQAKVMEMLSTFRPSGATPYHDAYENVRKVIQLQDPNLEQLRAAPAVAALMSQASLLGINASISPELFNILTEEITEKNAEIKFKENFGDIDPKFLSSVDALAKYYGLTQEQIIEFIGDTQANNQDYYNNALIYKKINHDGKLEVSRITLSYEKNKDDLNYCYIYPDNDNKFLMKLNFKKVYDNFIDLRIDPVGSNTSGKFYRDTNYPNKANTEINFIIEFTDDELKSLIKIKIDRVRSSPWDYKQSSVSYHIEEYSPSLFLLKLNKAIRLAQATQLTAQELEHIVLSTHTDLTLDAAVLSQVFYVKYYMQYYGIDAETALILCNASISQRANDNQISQFDRLFNTPPLNGQSFSIDDQELDLNPGSADDWRKAVLKRAFNADDISLYRLLQIAHRTTHGKIANSLNNLSALYLAKLLADSHQLTIDELDLLLVAIGEGKTRLSGIKDSNLSALINKLDAVILWLHVRQWSVYQLFVMTATHYDQTLTPEIQNLLDTVYNGLQGFDKEPADLPEAMAPYIAATLQLPSEKVAHSVLLWAEQLKPSDGKMTAEKFWQWLQAQHATNPPKPAATQEQVVQYCQCLSQLALIYRATGLSENAFCLFITQPDVFGFPSGTAPAHDALSLMMLTRFADWVNGLGEKASPVLTAFENKALTVEQLANAMNLDVNLLSQASIQAQQHQQVTKENAFSSWIAIDIILQWVGVSHQLGIAPQGVSALIALDYIPKITQATPPTYAQWETAAAVLTAGLDTRQADPLHILLNEARSAALSTYYISQVAGADAAIQSRDDLYQYLLIDNQVSAAIKTTRVAEAMASIQLYVNRALEGIEENANSGVITRQFFTDWDQYNKRYSTWAGVSQLVYYPENYIDPTMRIGQTKMMDTLLQQISQSQLNSDIVEDAFMSYLTAFEQVANLTVISAYHDNINNDQGLTYFIGRSETEAEEYYWRSVDHSKFSDGKFVANAWSEWNKIDCPINPYQNTIRPVMYKSRLYLIWLEQKEIAKPDGNTNQTKTEYRHELKLAHIRYDGSWNTPITFDVDGMELSKNEAPGLYCAGYQGEDTLLVMFYRKKDSLDNYQNDNTMQGLYIFSDMSSRNMLPEQIKVYRDNSYNQFDTNNTRRVNNRYAEHYEIPSSVRRKNYAWGNHYISMVYGGSIPAIRYQASSNTLKVSLSPKLNIIHNGLEDRERHQCNLMKKYGELGDKFIIYTNLTLNSYHSKNGLLFYPIYQYSGNASKLSQGRLLFHRDTNYPATIEAWIEKANRSLKKKNVATNDDYIVDPENRPNDLKHYIFMYDFDKTATNVKGPVEINTAISPAKVQVIVKIGGKEQIFTADKYVSSQPAPSLKEMLYQFNELEIDASSLNFVNNSASIDVTFTAFAEDGRMLGREIFSIPVTRKVSTDSALTLYHNDNGAQYMQWGIYRTRLNTLFARQLVERATTGIDTILSMETQNIQEPKLGKGFYATLELPKYNPEVHGNERWVKIYYTYIYKDQDTFLAWQGMLDSDKTTRVTIFYPYLDRWDEKNDYHLQISYKNQVNAAGSGKSVIFHYDPSKDTVEVIRPGEKPLSKDIIESVTGLNQYTEPMDFSGANALYFWELFYYTPMLVAQRLLHEQNFDETHRWLKYVWSPSGYIVHGQIQTYKWNVRPLLEDTSWNSDPLDSVDPDAVAQNDPMHYKVSTFMRTLDLLLARGDYAYRQLERDTLNEAKMWYMQALHLLGEKPYLPLSPNWDNPRLDKAADITTQKAYAQAITRLRQNETTAARTANSLTGLFLPQINDVMMNYWQTLEQRLYNLRHNLSIDGQPLSLPIFATPADPKALLSAAVATSQGGGNLPKVSLLLWRFPQMLDSARSMVGQLIQFGATLQNIIERQDGEALNALLQNQAAELILTTIRIQDKTIEELDAEKTVLEKSRAGAQSRFDSYSKLHDENINAGEEKAMSLRAAASGMTTAVQAARLAGAALDLAPNMFGFAVGGSRWGSIAEATGYVMEFSASVMNTEADKISQSESYRRRRQEWEIQRNNAEAELKQIEAQLNSLTIRREAAVLQTVSLKTQQEQTQAQLAFLQRKFSNQALYNWLRGRLAAIYFQFYDLAAARCLMAEMAYRWETNESATNFIKPGAWQGTYAGLLAGEALMLNLAQMEETHLKQDQRALEVERTVSLSAVYAGLPSNSFNLSEKVTELVKKGSGNSGNGLNTLAFGTGADTQTSLQASLSLADLNIFKDYPASLGKTRRIKQISITLPALLGPYQDIQAVLTYGGENNGLARGCKALAISRGMNDSGQFQLDFNDGKFLPFEGIAIDDKGALVLSFPNATSNQKAMLQTLSDIILHIRYTILS
ncbi:neuraminidase-like domain-containing protein [Xenorhabdus sp. XENO-7]|uniref:Neuraminidase-like domain-containing protein n=1 Tax=Xenorhabdus aichiensis TaxID=3025874 RepID=A0ABT5M2A7_9GAMM|nr:neuraminidase-like domain-containing protein [Xenorhabdus aichiensis]MDC9621814.1 neuraminidase-like domain-containing protein [Xenorhabdus aichiensis]